MKIEPGKLRTRIISAVILAPPCLWAAWAGGFWLTFMIAAFMGASLWEWWKLSWHLKSKSERFIFWGGVLYIFIAALSFYTMGKPEWNHAVFAVLGMVVCSDTGAYFAGKLYGGPRLFPAVSPNKTWAGLGGAMGGAILAALLCWLLGVHIQSLGFVFFGGAAIGLAGQGGDLLESWAKRLAGVKDAGQLIPGHGGVLDRIDSLMLATPVFLLISGLS